MLDGGDISCIVVTAALPPVTAEPDELYCFIPYQEGHECGT